MLRSKIVQILPLDHSTQVNFLSGINADIISVIHSNVARAARQTREISKYFKGSTDLDTARNIWKFLKKEIKYKRDREGYQDIKLPGRFVAEASGDCKSYSLFTAAILDNLNIPYSFRYASYSANDPTPQHVYIVTDSGIIIDAVWNAFNSQKAYKHKKDYRMRISTLSGIGCNDCQAKALSGTVMMGGIGKISLKKAGSNIQSKLKNTKVVKAAAKVQNQVKKTAVVKAAAKVQNQVKKTAVVKTAAKVQTKLKNTGVVKTAAKIQNQIKKAGPKAIIGAAPRRAYRTLIAVNFRGWATKLATNPTEARKIWEKAGGSYKELEKSISTGVKKKALFGSNSQQLRTVDGIGEPVTLATIGAFIATATPIILLFANLTKDKAGASESTDPTATSTEASPVEDIINSVANIFSSGQKTDTSAPQNQTSNTDEVAPVTSSSSSGLMLLAVGLGAYLLLK